MQRSCPSAFLERTVGGGHACQALSLKGAEEVKSAACKCKFVLLGLTGPLEN